jgi:hypothetical protein
MLASRPFIFPIAAVTADIRHGRDVPLTEVGGLLDHLGGSALPGQTGGLLRSNQPRMARPRRFAESSCCRERAARVYEAR